MTVGSLTINLGMITQDVTKGVAKGKAELESLASSVKSMNSILNLAGIATGIGGSVAMLATLKSKLDEISSTARFADRLGIGTDQLQSLQYAAKRTGLDAEVFNMALIKMNKNIAEAAKGGGDLENTFTMLGTSSQQLAQMPADQRLIKIAQGMKQVHNDALRTNLTLEIFGRGAEGLGTLLSKGEQGIEQFRQQAKDLGLLVSDQDVANIREYKKLMAEVNAFFEGAKTGAAKTAASAFVWLKDLAFFVNFGNFPDKSKTPAPDEQRDAIDNMVADAEKMKELQRQVQHVINETQSPLDKYMKQLETLDKLYAQNAITLEEFDAAVNKYNDDLQRSDYGEELRQSVQAATDAQNEMWDAIMRAEEAALSPLDRYIDKYNELVDLWDTGLLTEEAWIANSAKLLQDLEAANGARNINSAASAAGVLGTAAEYSARVKAEQGLQGQQDRTPKDILATAREQRDLQRRTNELLANQALEVISF